MNILSLFKQTENISGNQARSLIEKSSPGTLQLVDVRQPSEYDQAHIPGAQLIPLKELENRTTELKPELKTIVYCRSGVRSKAGCQILRNKGFSDVVNMTGGITQWQGQQIAGSEISGFEHFIPGDFISGCSMAWTMEKVLQQFYLLLADKTDYQELRELLQHMARLESGHMNKLSAQYPDIHEELEKSNGKEVIEGGIEVDAFLKAFKGYFDSVDEILHIGMLFEAQAYDLYSRLSRQESNPELSEFYQKMAEEEQSHFDRLTNELEKRIM